jgi:hypothetical protein
MTMAGCIVRRLHVRESFSGADISGANIEALSEDGCVTPDELRLVSDGRKHTAMRLFLAYQTSIVDHFEFVTKNWVNDVNFKDTDSGFDPILGQNNAAGANRQRQFSVINLAGDAKSLQTNADWVIPSGGDYFFAPSI